MSELEIPPNPELAASRCGTLSKPHGRRAVEGVGDVCAWVFLGVKAGSPRGQTRGS